MPRISGQLLALLPLALLAPLLAATGCANTPDALTGTWQLTGVTCDGTTTPRVLGSTFSVSNYTFNITYAIDGTFTATLKLPSCGIITTIGTYEREGLDVVETQTTTACGTGCISYVPCQGISGSIPTTGVHRFRMNAPDGKTMEQIQHSPNGFCTSSQQESEVFTLQ